MSSGFRGIPGLKGKIAGLMAIGLTMVLPMVAQAAVSDGKPVCLDVTRIDHTEVLNDHQILFYAYGHKTWVNTLPYPCRTLTRQEGFLWQSSVPQYCDNLETIRVLRTGETCLLGAFTPYEKPARSS